MKTLAGCCLIHLCIGSVYAASVMYSSITQQNGWDISTLVWGFALTILALGWSASRHQHMFAGHVRRIVLYLGMSLWVVSQTLNVVFAIGGLEYLYYISSILLGLAIGLLYVLPINIVAEYGYAHLGLASGSVVCCFGLGSIIASKLFTVIPLDIMPVVYGAYTLIMLLGTRLIQDDSRIPAPGEFQKDRQWYAIASIFFLNIGIGISLLSNMVQLSVDNGLDTSSAVVLVALAGAFNAGGRILYSALSDRFGAWNTFCLLLWVQLASISCVLLWNMWAVPVLMIISVYGGVFAIMPSLMKGLYGTTTPYSQSLIVWGLAGLVCPVLFSYLGISMLLVMSVGTVALAHSQGRLFSRCE